MENQKRTAHEVLVITAVAFFFIAIYIKILFF
jgi:hypothetical protein